MSTIAKLERTVTLPTPPSLAAAIATRDAAETAFKISILNAINAKFTDRMTNKNADIGKIYIQNEPGQSYKYWYVEIQRIDNCDAITNISTSDAECTPCCIWFWCCCNCFGFCSGPKWWHAKQANRIICSLPIIGIVNKKMVDDIAAYYRAIGAPVKVWVMSRFCGTTYGIEIIIPRTAGVAAATATTVEVPFAAQVKYGTA